MSTLIKAENISLNRHGMSILDNVSIDVHERDFQTIIGPNGAGKTTLLKILMGLIRPESGSVYKSDECRIGYMPQKIIPLKTVPLKVIDFLELRSRHKHQSLKDSISFTKIEPILQHPLYAVSGGEMQRVLLARALSQQPNLLILDEPAQNLDLSGQLSFYKLLNTIYQEYSVSIIMVSHDLHLVMASTKKVVCLFHHICCQGAPSSVTQSKKFAELFGNDMRRMMAIYHHHDHNHRHNYPIGGYDDE